MSALSMNTSEATAFALVRRLRSLATTDLVRVLLAAVILFLLIDLVRLSVTSPTEFETRALVTTMDVTAYVAIICALWRPRLGLALAAAPLATALFWPSTSMDAVLLTVVTALAVLQLARRPALLVSAGLAGYVALRVAVVPGAEPRLFTLLVLGLSLAVGLVAGWVGHVVRERGERTERSAFRMATENARIRADERRALSADLHDVVVHHLSTASLHLMAAHGSGEPAVLRRALTAVERSNAAALSELRLLVRVLRDDPATGASGTEIRELAERESPTQAGADGQLLLIRAGFEPAVRVPAAADGLDMTVQRTLARLINETVRNQQRHALPGSRCTIEVQVSDHQVSFHGRNPRAADAPADPAWGWGLRGVRERISLTGGTFSAGPVGEEWIVAATIPHE
ncbi:histidine kinase [Propioniciclava soli]|uniref:histidine kinase n=1 Tax=Propioniciclava soli TaxID=2775081 RepID=A0ABZ3C6Y5_9ACTN